MFDRHVGRVILFKMREQINLALSTYIERVKLLVAYARRIIGPIEFLFSALNNNNNNISFREGARFLATTYY